MIDTGIQMEPIHGKRDSFYGNRSIVLSKKQLDLVKKNPRLGELYLTCIGFYPHAKNHFRKRKKGIHDNILIYCIEGSGHIQVNDNIFNLTPNSFFVIEAGHPHLYWASTDSPWSIYWLHFGGKRSECFSDSYNKVNRISTSSNSRVDDRIRLFSEVITILESGFTKDIIEYSNLFINSLLASFFYIATYRTAKGYMGIDPVDQSIFYMQKNIEKSLKIREIAQNVNLSESHLSRVFKNKTGSSPMDYFINLKMQEAIRLLSNQSLRIKEVAFMLGYNDPFYFSRIFTKHIGTYPTTFLRTGQRV